MPEFAHVFIASSIHTAVIVGTFLVLWYKTAEESFLWKRVWLIGIFMALFYALATEQRGFQALEDAYAWSGGEELATLAQGAMYIMMWVFILLFGWLLVTLAYDFLRGLYVAGSVGKKDYGNEYGRDK